MNNNIFKIIVNNNIFYQTNKKKEEILILKISQSFHYMCMLNIQYQQCL